jgi:tetratricopeptide (TPR) repeat protein
MGTPSYMAPEQAAGQTGTVGPATDVYALGALLYELLTGRPPFRAATSGQTLYQVLHDEPVAPTRFQPSVPRDLETICLKCLRKEAAKRYLNAAVLADDLRRFLEGRPITARRSRLWERLGKWARRRPAAAALVLVSGLAGLILAIGGYRYQRDLERHNQELTAANLAIGQERDEAEQQRKQALENLVHAADAVDQMLRRLGFDRLGRVPKMDPTRAELLEDAVRFYDRLLAAHPGDPGHRFLEPALRLMQANTYVQSAFLQRQLGQLAQARARFDKALDLVTELRCEASNLSATAPLLRSRALLEVTFPGIDQKLLSTPSGILSCLQCQVYEARASVWTDLRDLKRARADLEASLAVREEQLALQPEEPAYHRFIAFTCMNLAVISRGDNKPEQVKLYLTRARREAEELVRQQPDNREYTFLLGWALRQLGIFCFENGERPQAVPLLEKALETLRKAADANSGLEQQVELGSCWRNFGWVLHHQGDLDRAVEAYREALAIRARLTREHPEMWEFAQELGLDLYCLGQLHADKRELEPAVESFARALDTLDRIVANPLAAAQARETLRKVLAGRSDALLQLKRYPDALKDLDRAITLADGEQRARIRLVRAIALAHSGDHRRAVEEIEAMLGEPSFPANDVYDAACVFALATGQETDRDTAEQYAQRALQLLTQAQGAGFFKAADRRGLLDNDPDLAAVRPRKDFESLRTKVKE